MLGNTMAASEIGSRIIIKQKYKSESSLVTTFHNNFSFQNLFNIALHVTQLVIWMVFKVLIAMVSSKMSHK